MPKPLTVWITTNCGKFLNRWDYQTSLPVSRQICLQVKKQQLAPDMEHWTGSKLGKEYDKVLYCHPAYLTYMQSTSWKMLGWMNYKLESRLPGEISTTSDMQMMYSAYKLNKQGDSIQPWHTPFPILNQSIVPHPVLSVFDLHTGFSGGRWRV